MKIQTSVKFYLLTIVLLILQVEVQPCFADYLSTTPVLIKTLFAPYDDTLTAYLNFLNRAQHSVLIAIYSFNDPVITDKLVELHRRGVQVRLVMDRSQSHGKNEQIQLARLQQEGIELHIGTSEEHGQIMHDKFTVIDNAAVEDGSWNYTRSADFQDNVANFIDSPERAARFTAYWERMRQAIDNQSEISNYGH